MRTRRSIKLDEAARNVMCELKCNNEYILSLETAVLASLYERGLLSKRQLDICEEKLRRDVRTQ